MDYTREAIQVKRVQDKLVSMAQYAPKLVHLEEPTGIEWLEKFEKEQNIRLPEDYREIISCTANGGWVPLVCNFFLWISLQNIENQKMSLDVPYPPAENPECFEGKLVQFHNVTKLP